MTSTSAENSTKAPEKEALSRLVGGRLSSVHFVMSYLMLGFDARGVLTLLVWPEIHLGEAVTKFGQSGYRDLLCSFIMAHVVSADISSDDTVDISLDNGARLEAHLSERPAGLEQALLSGPQNYLFVFS